MYFIVKSFTCIKHILLHPIHAWMDTCIGKSEATNQDIPVAYLTCNGSPPVGDQPSLMTFQEVETLFHETGHGLQHMLTTVILFLE